MASSTAATIAPVLNMMLSIDADADRRGAEW
jgi:hypothetical protein